MTGVLNFYDYNDDSDYDYLSNILTVGSNGYHYSIQRDYTGNSYLYVIDPSDWTANFIGNIGIKNVAALDFMPAP
jgi:hypothetical protein